MRVLRRAVALGGLLILTCFAVQPANAVTPRNGHGLFLADDDWEFGNPSYTMPSLGPDFAKLRPKLFRLQVIWNAMEPAPPNPTQAQVLSASRRAEWVARTHALITKAKSQGVERIILTLRANHSGTDFVDVGTGGYTPTATRYEIEIAKVVREFASKVDVWGGINEPNLWQTGPHTIGAIPAATLVDYQASLAETVGVWDSGATWTSPDFNDETDNWASYATNYKNLGGDWGHVAAFHPYAAVQSQDMATVNQFAQIVPAGQEIWVTEVGAKHLGDPAGQNARTSWIANALANHSRVTKLAYYNMRGSGSSGWDTGLLNPTFTRRPAWSTWCAATHGDNSAHPDCSTPLRLDVFVPGTDGRVHHIAYDGGWHGWENDIGGLVAPGSGPAAVSWGPGRIDLFVRGTDNALHHRAYDGGQWHPWENLGGQLTGDPAVSSWGHGRLDVFVPGTDGRVHHIAYDGGWHGWENDIGGLVAPGSGPAAVSWGPGRIDLFVRGTDNALHHRAYDGGQWHPWENFGGQLTGDPDVASWAHGRLDVFVPGTDARVHHIAYDGGWHGWENDIGGVLAPGSGPAATAPASNRIDVFTRNVDGALGQQAWQGSWLGWVSFGGVLTGNPAVSTWR